MLIDGGYTQCPKCGKNLYDFPKCERCGTNYEEYKNQEMINHLKRFGFEEVIKYHRQNFIQKLFKKPKKIRNRYLQWGNITAHKHTESTNRIMYFGSTKIGTFNHYGDYENVERALKHFLWEYMQENELYIKSQKREQLLNQIL